MGKYWIYILQTNWADEMDIEGFVLLNDKDKKKHELCIAEDYKDGGFISYGTNEEEEYSNYESVKELFRFEELTDMEFIMLTNTFKKLLCITEDDYPITFGHTGPLNIFFFYDCVEDDLIEKQFKIIDAEA